jgi:presenilin-like A22 family membrane protease
VQQILKYSLEIKDDVKHSLSITTLLVVLFLVAQVVGISLLLKDIQEVRQVDGKLVIEHRAVALGERPETQGFTSFIYLLLGVAIGTALVLLLIKFSAFRLWKIWFLIAIWVSTTIAFGVILPATIAVILCLILAVWKVFWPNPVVHNVTEIFMYAGLAVLLVPIFTLFWVTMLLLVVSVYDIIAVWYSKHMVVMAEAQTKSNLFAGLYIPKSGGTPKIQHVPSPKTPHSPPVKASAAILGGGDIAFPLIFSGVAMDWLIINHQPKMNAFFSTLIITLFATVALALLFYYAKKDKFYPAMPFLTAGCLVGLGVIVILQIIWL